MEVNSVEINTTTGNVTLVTTTEAVALAAPAMTLERPTGTFLIIGWAQVTTGTDTTKLTPRIRRGTLITDTLVSEANAIDIGAAVGSNENCIIMASETLSGAASAQYCLTVQQTAASANGTILQAGIVVLQLN